MKASISVLSGKAAFHEIVYDFIALVAGLLQTTGGRIRVDSKPGQGTTFTLDLPAPMISGGLLNTNSVELRKAQEHVV